MRSVVGVLKAIGPPGSLGFLGAAIAAAAVLWTWTRRRRLALAWLVVVAAGYLVMALPIVADATMRSLPLVAPPGAEALRSIRTLFILDGDNREGRTAAATAVCRLAHPQTAWLVGGPAMRVDLIWAGMPRDHIYEDDSMWNTRTQVAFVVARLAHGDAQPAGLVASALQMPRIAALVHRAGVDLVLVPSDVDARPAATGLRRLVPSLAALAVTRDALYEHVALVYYRLEKLT